MSCKIVADIGINHNGDVDLAKQMICMAKQAGCDYVKFQKRTVGLVYTQEELDKPRESPWGTTNRHQKEGLEFTEAEYVDIDAFCNSIQIPWFASPWDRVSVEFLTQFEPPYIKVASAMLTNIEVLEKIRETGIPVILSTGMSLQHELDQALEYLGGQVEYILACTSTYPTATHEMNLRFITTLKKQYPHWKIGFSNHHPGVFHMASTVVLGAEMIEFHITPGRSFYGSDQAASIEAEGVRKLVKYVRDTEIAMGHGDWTVFPNEIPIRDKLRK